MDFKFQRANRVRNSFDVIAERMRPIVHRVNAPFVPGAMMRCVPDAIENGIAQPDVGCVHIDFRAQRARAIGKLAGFHSRKQIETFINRPLAKAAGLSQTAIFVRVFARRVINVRFAFADEIHCVFVEPVEIIRCIQRRAADLFIRPAIDQPMYVGHD